jgi:hypothetical protein
MNGYAAQTFPVGFLTYFTAAAETSARRGMKAS